MLIKEKNIFIAVTTILRLVQGIACGSYSVIIYSLVPEYYPERIEEVYSYMELFSGISTSVSPLIGMLLYEFVGSGLTFMIFSLVYLVLLFIVNKNIRFSATENKQSEKKNLNNLSITELLKNRPYLVAFGIYTVNSIGFFVVNPILGERVKEITGSTGLIGASFSIFSVCYAIGGVALGQFFKKYKLNKKSLFIVSSIMLFLSYSMLGFTNSFSNFVIALILLGFGEALCVIPYIPEAIELGLNVFPNDYAWVGDMASLFWNIGFAVAEFVGPILGGSLTSAYGFEFCVYCYALIVAAMLVIYLMFGSVWSRYTGLNERLLSSYATFGNQRNAKFFTFDNEKPVFRAKPVFLSQC